MGSSIRTKAYKDITFEALAFGSFILGQKQASTGAELVGLLIPWVWDL